MLVAARLCTVAVLLPGLHAQSSGTHPQSGSEGDTPEDKRASIGFRVLDLPSAKFGLISRHSYGTTIINNKTPYDWQFNTTPRSGLPGLGASFEYLLGKRSTLTADLMYHRLQYDAVTDIYSGTDDPTTAADERLRTTRTERTKARIWNLPVLVHYGEFRPRGAMSKLYLAGGGAVSLVSNVRSQTGFSSSDGTTSNNYNPTKPSHRQTAGAVAGIGFRFVDDFNIKVTPEVRYTRWLRPLFSTDSTQSSKNQLEVGFGLTF